MFSVVQKYIEKDTGSEDIWLCILQLTSDNNNNNKKNQSLLATGGNQ